MPGLNPAVGDLLQVRVYCQANNQVSLNVLHYVVVGVGGVGLDLNTYAAQISTIYAALYKVWMPPTADYAGVTVQNLTFPTSIAVTDRASAGPGTTGTELTPRQVSGLIHWTTTLAGRANRGRSYIGFPSSTFLTATGELSVAGGTALANVQAAIGPIKNVLVGGDSLSTRLAIRPPRIPGPPPVEQYTTVSTGLASNLLATQRRRGDYGRSNLPL